MVKITSCLIGEDSLLIQSGNLLLSRGHTITAVVSQVKKIQAWAKKNNIPLLNKISDLIANDNSIQFDYIFSVVNSQILSEKVFKLAKYGAINYHDSPLPKYAGLNATSWAILNNEKNHGVTWHVMNNKIDQGDIVKQKHFPIFVNDTAFTLNLRCYEAAIESFQELLIDIEKNRVIHEKQHLVNQSYYNDHHELPNLGFIDWKIFTAEQIDRTCRALSLGHYANHLGTLKLSINGEYFIVQKVEVFGENQSTPGTVCYIEEQALHVATATKIIKIIELLTFTGKKITIEEFFKRFDINIGYLFSSVDSNDLSIVKKPYEKSIKNEKFWLNKLTKITEHTVFSDKGKELGSVPVIPNHHINLKKIFPNKTILLIKDILLTSILTYLYRLNDHDEVSVFLLHESFETIHKNCAGLLSIFSPLIFKPSFNLSLDETQHVVNREVLECNEKGMYLTDIVARHPLLQENSFDPSIVISFSENFNLLDLPPNCVLFFQIHEQEGSINIHHCFDLSIRDLRKEILSNMAQHISNILINLINNSHFSVTSFGFLQAHERYKMLRKWGQGRQLPVPNMSIINCFQKQVEMNPNKTALIMQDKSISYKNLLEMSEKIHHFIVNQYPGQGSMIGIYMDRNIDMFAVILGILKSNNIYVPLDTKYPLSRVRYIEAETNMRCIFTQDKYLSTLVDCFETYDELDLVRSNEVLSNDLLEINKTNELTEDITNTLCYVMFTSGTTGNPKGVMVTEENVLNYCYWFLESTQFDNTSIMDFSSSVAFDLSIPCTIAPLLAGGTVALCSEKQKTNPRHYLEHLKKNQVSHVEMTPGYLHLTLNYPNEVQQLIELKWLLLGADAVSKSDVEKWLALCPHHHLINEYGPTETTVAATMYYINPSVLPDEATISIGSPGYNSQCYILDKYKNLCPMGMLGELYIGGKQVTKGYLNKPELTKEKFIVSYISEHKEILYKTGDIVCWLPDGNLQFFGRNDNQVKIHGYRIEMSEIESSLVAIPGIKQALVTVQDEKFVSKYLRAYLVCDQPFNFDDEIRKSLKARLPSYMVPKEFCLVDTMPLRENEKINYDALQNKEVILLTSHDKKILEKNSSFQEEILSIWQNIFNNNLITTHDDFFDLGGDSLMALQVLYKMQQHYTIDIQLSYLFEHPTVALLANKISELYKIKHLGERKSIVSQRNCVIQLSKGNGEFPLFLIHPVGGTIFWYKQLAILLQGKYTIYGIQDPNVDGDNVVFNSIEEMASYYLSMIKRMYSGERYFLGGASFGATVAFEMVNQLATRGNNLPFLSLFDGWAVYPEVIIEKNSLTILKNNTLYEHELDNEKKKILVDLEKHRRKILTNYKVPNLNCRNVTLFKAKEIWPSFQPIDNSHNGWQPYVKTPIKIFKTPGNHETMFFNPNVKKLAHLVEKMFIREINDIIEYQ